MLVTRVSGANPCGHTLVMPRRPLEKEPEEDDGRDWCLPWGLRRPVSLRLGPGEARSSGRERLDSFGWHEVKWTYELLTNFNYTHLPKTDRWL